MSCHSSDGLRIGLVAALLGVVTPTALSAQSILFVRVRGEVGPIPHATVEIAQRDTVWRRLDTDAQGAARFAAMLPGTYEVRVRAYGYRPEVEKNVNVGDGSTVLDVSLKTEAIALEGLTATSSRVQIRHENTDFDTRVDRKAIALMPLTHDARDLVALVPGARPGHVWGGSSFQADNYQIDGLSNNNPGMGGDLVKPNINWIDHVEVRGLGAGAEYGGFQGGLIDVVTKRGTNDFHGMVRSSLEDRVLNASNLVSTEIGSEVTSRRELEGEAQGPIVRDRLFYYVSAKDIHQAKRTLNHLQELPGAYSPTLEHRTEDKLFGKVTWTPRPATEVNVSTAFLGTWADNYDGTGYEDAGAGHRYSAPTWLFNGSWRETLGTTAVLEARLNHFSLDERQDAYGGTSIPGIRIMAFTPPYTSFGNNPFTLRDAPSSTSANVSASFEVNTGALRHLVKVGADYSYGTFLNRRIRNGGMTWFPTPATTFGPNDPTTWVDPDSGWTATQWGGEVHLDANVANTAVYAQSSISVGSRVVLTPGLRWGHWQGWITPPGGTRFEAVQDQALDPRVGISVDLVPDGSWTAKAHWGRYHQDMVTQMFDRAAGSNVFTNEEVWYYRGGPVTDPSTPFTVQQRDSLAALGIFTREAVNALNETGPVENYHQPYLNEWLVGVEKQFGTSAKLSVVYTRRTNHDMVALVDKNIATDYTLFEDVASKAFMIRDLYLPNDVLLDRLRCRAEGACPNLQDVPGLAYADTTRLSWNPQYAVTNAPGARRYFGQFQLAVNVSRPTWGGTFSVVFTDLRGNLDNVTGYTDPTTYDPGPFVRINESLRSFGPLENYASAEAKISVWGNLSWGILGGLFWTYRSGDHYSGLFRITTLNHYSYWIISSDGKQRLDNALIAPLEGDELFLRGGRGQYQLDARSNIDIRLERAFRVGGRELDLSLDVFNVLGYKSITKVQSTLDFGRNPFGYGLVGLARNVYFQYPLQRVQPRTLRLGAAVKF